MDRYKAAERSARRRLFAALVTAGALLGCLSQPAGAQTGGYHSHVRVVLDTSGSMEKNDPKRLAVLSAILLRDLIDPNTTRGDSYEVIPFDPQWTGQGAVPETTGRPIVDNFRRKQAFVDALRRLPYDVGYTSFYPGLAAAVEDLEDTSGGEYDHRVVVLITDGLPIQQWRDEDARRIRDELLPRMQRERIRFYVMAFGAEASKNQGYFHDLLPSAGNVFVDRDGQRLLRNMIDIFGRSFGYTASNEQLLPGASNLDLAGGRTPSRAAVVVLSEGTRRPSFRLTPPPGGTVNAPGPIRATVEKGASYALRWILSPHPGRFGISVSDVPSGRVAVLRPTELDLEIEPDPPKSSQADRTMAGTPFPLRILVTSPAGATGDPGPVDLSYRTLGPRIPDPESGRLGPPAWSDRFTGVPAANAAGQATGQGRAYSIEPGFAENPAAPSEPYVGYLELEARRGEALVASRRGDFAHRVEVYPQVAIAPRPAVAALAPRALESRERACREFELELTSGTMPRRDPPEYGVRAVLRVADPDVLDAELHEAYVTLDGLPLSFASRPGSSPGIWHTGRSFSRDELLGPHELCVVVGRPTRGDPANPLVLTLEWTLAESPYDDFDVIAPFETRLPLAAPSILETLRGPFFLLALALAVGLLAWYGRGRPYFPEDLGYSLAPEVGGAALRPRPLPERPARVSLLGLLDRRSLSIPGQDERLGQVRPADERVFHFLPRSGVRIQEVEEGGGGMDSRRPPTDARGRFVLQVEKTYRLVKGGKESYRFRLEYLDT